MPTSPKTVPQLPEFPAGFVGGTSQIDMQSGWLALTAPIGPSAPEANIATYRQSIRDAGAQLREQNAAAVQAARDTVSTAELNRLTALAARYAADQTRLLKETEDTERAVDRAAVRGSDMEGPQAKLRAAREAYQQAGRYIDVTGKALASEAERVKRAQEDAARAVRQKLRAQLTAELQAAEKEIGNLVAARLPAVYVARAALEALRD